MSKINTSIAILLVFMLETASARTLEIDVYGMTCAFCVDSLERQFGKMPSVRKVEISLSKKKIRLKTDSNKPSLETVKQLILDAGFTPVKVIEADD